MLRNVFLLTALLLATSQLSAQTLTPDQDFKPFDVAPAIETTAFQPPFSITPILFIPDPNSFPAGYRPTETIINEDLANITELMAYFQDWYADALGLKYTVNIQPVVRMDAWYGLSSYDISWNDPSRRYSDGIYLGNTWGAVLGEVTSRGYSAGSSVYPNIVLIFCKGAGGFAGGAQWHHDPGGGMAMLGDWCLDAIAERIPSQYYVWWWGDKMDQYGATLHEAGHAWGMAHPGDYTNPVTSVPDSNYSVMHAFWNFPDYAANPADPDYPHRGLHAWSHDLGPGGVRYPMYQDDFMRTYRSDWFTTPRWPLGDMNCDGLVDTYDIDAFVTALLGQTDYDAAYPDCLHELADCNGDEVVDTYDIDGFVDLIAGS